eukprot:15469484-Alexandrium_andersonii.AAC.1
MLVKSAQLGLCRCAGRATKAESPRGRGRAPSTEAPWGSLPQTGAVLWAKMILRNKLGRRKGGSEGAL